MLTQLVDSGRSFSGQDVQETTFSLDAVARFVCNTLDEVLEAQAQSGFDAVIIGSGMYGAFTAAQIYERARRTVQQGRPRVLVLEGGPFLISEHVQNLTRMGAFDKLVARPIVDENQSFLTQIPGPNPGLQGMSEHHRCVGGKSPFWGGWAPPLSNLDSEDDLAHWPPEVREFLLSERGYQRIAEQIGTSDTADYVKGPLLDALRAKAKKIVDHKTVPGLTDARDAPIAVQAEGPVSGLFSMDKFSSLPLLLDSIREDAESSEGRNTNRFLFLVPNAQVVRLETRDGRVQALDVQVREPSRNPEDPNARHRIRRIGLKSGAMVFLAGNTINSTRLALNSLPKPSQIGPSLAGKNLMAHVRGNYVWRVRKSLLTLPALHELATATLHIEGRHPIGAPVNRKGRFHFQFYALGSEKPEPNPEEYLYRLLPNLEDIDDAREAVQDEGLDEWVVIGIRTCGEMFGDVSADPSTRDSSAISVNPFGGAGDDLFTGEDGQQIRVPKAFVAMIQRPVDEQIRKAQTDAAFAFIAALTGKPPAAARLTDRTLPLHLFSGGEDGVGTTYHESGTLWMGTDPERSVTDVHGRFHHITNAACVDQSLFPTVGSANPVPTGLALSSMIARQFVSRFTSSAATPLEDGFTSLFDGTLNGWTGHGDGNIQALPGLNIIECGSRGTDSVLGFIRTQQKFQNFTLRLDWKTFDITANSGVFLRMPDVIGNDLTQVYANSIEVQIDETGKEFQADRTPQSVYGSSLHKTGAVYGIAPATRWAARAVSQRDSDGYWNAFEMTVQGNHITVKLNGDLVVDKATLPAPLLGSGSIGLQCHTDIVQFRNIRIQPL